MSVYEIVNHAIYLHSATPPCRDFVHPRTGVSDCPQRKHLCENTVYRQLMAEQCPLTCNKCNGATNNVRPSGKPLIAFSYAQLQ
ncbi:unnamed protein product [Strongylus vulgaris]|uniref:ShKT domain-containing protein n=1 Tax=Strongylus vulgaris TaxID=40348 RepID=A0A3P7K0V2_STRVU|nr:unnamed protein product [Strongylus vulgaris]